MKVVHRTTIVTQQPPAVRSCFLPRMLFSLCGHRLLASQGSMYLYSSPQQGNEKYYILPSVRFFRPAKRQSRMYSTTTCNLWILKIFCATWREEMQLISSFGHYKSTGSHECATDTQCIWRTKCPKLNFTLNAGRGNKKCIMIPPVVLFFIPDSASQECIPNR